MVGSHTASQIIENGERPSGIYYALPKGVVEAKLEVVITEGVNQQEFVLDIGEPKFIPDPKQRYFLRYRPLPQYHDDIKITVNDNTFIKKIDANTTDKTGEILVNVATALAAGGGQVEAAATPAKRIEQEIARLTFDPTDPDERRIAIGELERRLQEHISQGKAACHSLVKNTPYPAGKAKSRAAVRQTKQQDAALQPLLKHIKSLEDDLGKLTNKQETGTLDTVEQSIKDFSALKQQLAAVYAQCQTATALDIGKLCKRTGGPLDDEVCDRLKQGPRQTCTQTELDKMKQSLEAVDLHLNQLATQKTVLEGKVTKLTTEVSAHESQKKLCESFTRVAPKIHIEIKDYRAEADRSAAHLAHQASMKDNARPMAGPAGARIAGASIDCTIGVCYRTKEPYRIDYGIVEKDAIKGGTNGYALTGVLTKIIELPNQADLVAFDIQRGFFINKVTTLDFTDDGFLDNAYVKKNSELYAVSKLPLDILDAVAEGFQLRVKIVSKQRDVARNEVNKLKAQQSLERVRSSGPLESGPTAVPQGGARIVGARSFVRAPTRTGGNEQ